MLPFISDTHHPLSGELSKFIGAADFPCVGAKSALNRGGLEVVVARDFTSAWDDLRILPALLAIVKRYRARPEAFLSLAVLFETGAPDNEQAFEQLLWERLTSLTRKDEWLGQPADTRVAHDPEDPHFAMSFGGEAFFVVGMHPNASRPARRFSYPAMIFNLHDQFTRLKQQGRYDKLRETILGRDLELAGSVNPMIAPHGTLSGARQYSGRSVDEDWRCPFSGRGVRDAA